VRTGDLLFVSGHGECGQTLKRGKVGRELTIEEGQRSAERVGLCVLATVKAALGGDLGRVRQAVRILGMVNSPEDFTEHPKVLNGFSEVLRVAFGDAGLAARAAVGMQSLPNDIPVEVEAVFEIVP
jgi:enamine deaminase RidA (YjgF/YER057c/UK114 family)